MQNLLHAIIFCLIHIVWLIPSVTHAEEIDIRITRDPALEHYPKFANYLQDEIDKRVKFTRNLRTQNATSPAHLWWLHIEEEVHFQSPHFVSVSLGSSSSAKTPRARYATDEFTWDTVENQPIDLSAFFKPEPDLENALAAISHYVRAQISKEHFTKKNPSAETLEAWLGDATTPMGVKDGFVLLPDPVNSEKIAGLRYHYNRDQVFTTYGGAVVGVPAAVFRTWLRPEVKGYFGDTPATEAAE